MSKALVRSRMLLQTNANPVSQTSEEFKYAQRHIVVTAVSLCHPLTQLLKLLVALKPKMANMGMEA